jgi:phage repressor protein C with HTH and peptisase S24 domain
LDYEPRPTSGILEIDVRAGLGGGGSSDQTLVAHHGNAVDPVKPESWHFPATFVRNEIRRSGDRIRILETYGDSMAPTIHSGDRVIIDTDHRVPSPDGLYAIRDRFGSIVVKRLQALRRGDPPVIKIISDNPHHGEEEVTAVDLEDAIIGRVLWGLKRL